MAKQKVVLMVYLMAVESENWTAKKKVVLKVGKMADVRAGQKVYLTAVRMVVWMVVRMDVKMDQPTVEQMDVLKVVKLVELQVALKVEKKVEKKVLSLVLWTV